MKETTQYPDFHHINGLFYLDHTAKNALRWRINYKQFKKGDEVEVVNGMVNCISFRLSLYRTIMVLQDGPSKTRVFFVNKKKTKKSR